MNTTLIIIWLLMMSPTLIAAAVFGPLLVAQQIQKIIEERKDSK